MPITNVWLFDFMSGAGPGRELCDILSSGKFAGSQIRGKIAVTYKAVDSPSLDESALSRVVAAESSVVFLIVSKDQLGDARRLLRDLKGRARECSALIVTEAVDPSELVEMLRLGAADFITPPLKACDIIPRLWRLLGRSSGDSALLDSIKEKVGLQRMIGESRVFRDVVDKIPRLARCNACVLIAGETGTGKEMCARAIHYLGPRGRQPFVPVNCGAIPGELIENELFGHERGAYTDATRAQPGLIREADGGSLFLDEIDSLPPPAQVKLLRFLQEKEYRPLGSSKSVVADVRIIAATNANLDDAIKEGRLRRDLFYRLNVITIELPPLRDRREDIPSLARHFLRKYAAEFDSPATDFSDWSLRLLLAYDWPGNVRQLENLIARGVAMADRELIEPDDLELPNPNATAASAQAPSLREAKAQFERKYIENLLLLHGGNITRAAETARKDRRAFWELMRKHKIDASRFRPAHMAP
jgi:two-component system, NtrC family, response regulator GlrR